MFPDDPPIARGAPNFGRGSSHELAAYTEERYMQEFGYTGGNTRPLSQRSASSHRGLRREDPVSRSRS
jgi:hypothetical protein